MTQINSGDSNNTNMFAIQAAMDAKNIAKAGVDAAKQAGAQAPKLGMDTFRNIPFKSIPGETVKNMALSDALAQQGFFTRLAARIPFVKNFLGADFILNEAIGKLGKDAVGNMSKTQITKIMLEGGDDIAKKLAAGGVPQETIELLSQKAGERLAAMGGQAAQSAVQSTATAAAQNIGDDAIQAALNLTKSGIKDPKVVQEILKKGLSGDALVTALKEAGTTATSAKAIAKQAAELGTKEVASSAANQAAQTTTKEAAKGGIKGFFGKLLSGAKGNFIVAGIFALGSNAIQLATGQMNFKQFLALTALDTGAYGLIGMGSAAAGGAIGAAVGTAIPIPIVGTVVGFLGGLAIGMVGGWIYEKVARNPVKNMLGPSGGAYDPGAYPGPGQYPDPYAQQQDPYAQQPYQDPYAQQQPPQQQQPQPQPVTQQPYPQQPYPQQQAPAPAQDSGLTYEDASRILNGY